MISHVCCPHALRLSYSSCIDYVPAVWPALCWELLLTREENTCALGEEIWWIIILPNEVEGIRSRPDLMGGVRHLAL